MKIIEIRIPDIVEIEELKKFYEDQPIEELIESVRTHGQLNPVHIDNRNGLIDGYRRFEALKAIGCETVEAIVLPDNPGIQTRIVLNAYRDKTTSDQLREIREVFKMFPKRQGKRSINNEPYDRAAKISGALNGKWKGDVILNQLEYVLNNDIGENVLGKGIVEKGWKVEPCYEFLRNYKITDLGRNYGFTQALKEGR